MVKPGSIAWWREQTQGREDLVVRTSTDIRPPDVDTRLYGQHCSAVLVSGVRSWVFEDVAGLTRFRHDHHRHLEE